jgi:Fungal protein of unknown function (DUF2011)
VVNTENAEEETFEFRLFSSKSSAKPNQDAPQEQRVTRINIRSPTPLSAQGDGGFVVPFRPQSYYFTASADGGEKLRKWGEYAEVALGGEEVRRKAGSTVWVCGPVRQLEEASSNWSW